MPGEVELLRAQQLGDVVDPLLQALQIPGEDGVGGGGVPGRARRLRQGGAVAGELVQVGLEEERAGAVQRIQVAIQELPRQLGVERMVRELRALQDVWPSAA